MSVGTSFLNSAKRTIARHGSLISYEKLTQQAGYNSSTSEFDSETYATAVSFKALIENYEATEINGESIQQDDLRIVFAGDSLSTPPGTNDRVTINGVKYKAVLASSETVAGQIVTWTLQVRV